MIPLCDVKANYLGNKDAIDKAIGKVIDSGSFILGNTVKEFEKEFAGYIGTRYCIGVASGTAALSLAMMAVGVQPYDTVMCPTMTVTANYEAIRAIGARAKLYDNMNMPERIGGVVVHLHGKFYDVPHVIEDCAHAVGTVYGGQKAGSFGAAGCFSFFPSKVLGAFGDAGAVTTDDEALAYRVRAFRDHGRTPGEKYVHKYNCGYNLRMDAIQAAVLLAKLPRLNEYIVRRAQIAEAYSCALKGVGDIILPDYGNCSPSIYVYAIQTERRDELAKHLDNRGVQTGMHYPTPIHRQSWYWAGGDFSATDRYADRTLSLPLYPELPLGAVCRICNWIAEFYG